MDIGMITDIISNVGFPIAMCGAMGWYVHYTNEKHTKQVTTMNELHRQEMTEITQALKNNTIALTELCTLMKNGGKSNE